jgi:hypothetical protein
VRIVALKSLPKSGMQPYGIYGQSVELLRSIEDRLSTRKNIPLKRFIVVPAYLLLRGLEQMAISYGRGYAFAFVLSLLGLLLSNTVSGEWRPIAHALTAILNVFLVFSLIFAAPSTYSTAGTNAKHVQDILDRMRDWHVDNVSKVDVILRNVRIFEERVKRRLAIFRWLLGAGWALYYAPLLTETMKDWTTSRPSFGEMVTLFPPLGILAASFVAIEAYARGTDILFRCIELGCNERLSQIAPSK